MVGVDSLFRLSARPARWRKGVRGSISSFNGCRSSCVARSSPSAKARDPVAAAGSWPEPQPATGRPTSSERVRRTMIPIGRATQVTAWAGSGSKSSTRSLALEPHHFFEPVRRIMHTTASTMSVSHAAGRSGQPRLRLLTGDGQPSDAGETYRRYAPYVAAVAYRLLGRDEDVDDAVQEVFVRAIRGFDQLEDRGAIKGWLAAITVRVVARKLRRRRAQRLFRIEADYDSDPQRASLLADGSQVQALTPETRWVIERSEHEHTGLRLERGTARFEIAPRADRVFVVLAGPAELRVSGTVFRVAIASEAVTVAVERGHVDVHVFDRTHTLSEGEEGSFPLTSLAAGERRDGDGPAARVRAAPRWDVLARDGEYEQAYARLTQQGSRAMSDSPGELLLAADTARLTGHAARAVGYLERFLERYPTDPRGALTAFTLGRVHLQELGQPAKAANAFAWCVAWPLRESLPRMRSPGRWRAGLAPAARRRRYRWARSTCESTPMAGGCTWCEGSADCE